MTGQEIRKQISEKNRLIEHLLDKFILTNQINTLMEEIEDLRKQCKHEFDHGYCIWCGRPQDEVSE